ncbi:hypothetical protein BOTBODRAFT_407968 [Botryobasidium botryosum FD-172 SS1]|uniref:Uncharacterized protein n=1 Tax=Botryobasidium botryosum (strain FD-172 SS1) TaxID=930990 RepID=A0A067MAB6_BOTB1|nr:hypothetical protein BOTBODRAFT_407968 [Botryobasidium botryosum FD-172 SS1]
MWIVAHESCSVRESQRMVLASSAPCAPAFHLCLIPHAVSQREPCVSLIARAASSLEGDAVHESIGPRGPVSGCGLWPLIVSVRVSQGLAPVTGFSFLFLATPLSVRAQRGTALVVSSLFSSTLGNSTDGKPFFPICACGRRATASAILPS